MAGSFTRPKKRLGQHFLIDQNISRKIVALADLHPDDTVLEIGAGRGILTRALCGVAGQVIAVEVDAELAAALAGSLGGMPNLEIRTGDALKFPYGTLPPGTVVVANLPYYISTPLLFALLAAHAQLDRLVLMLQTEVARRLVATPGSPDYGVLAVLAQFRAEPRLAFRVSRTCFRPRPKVESAVVLLRLRRTPAVQVADEAGFVATVRAAFAHRRKTLANSLRDEGYAADRIARALDMSHLAAVRRAETLSLQEFAALANALHER